MLSFQDMQKLQSQFDDEKQRRSELELQLAKMNQLLTTGQEALQQEQKTVEMLRQQVLTSDSTSSSPNNTSATATKVSFLEVTASKKCYSYYKSYSHLRHFTSF